MSKISEAKKKQGYVPKAVPQTCMNCASFKMDVTTEPSPWAGCPPVERQRNLRCGIGGFKVMKMGTCDEWSGKE